MMKEMEFYFQSDNKPIQWHQGLPETFKIDACVINLEHCKRN